MLNFSEVEFRFSSSQVNGVPSVLIEGIIAVRADVNIDRKIIAAAEFHLLDAEQKHIRSVMWGKCYGDVWAEAARLHTEIGKLKVIDPKELNTLFGPLFQKLSIEGQVPDTIRESYFHKQAMEAAYGTHGQG